MNRKFLASLPPAALALLAGVGMVAAQPITIPTTSTSTTNPAPPPTVTTSTTRPPTSTTTTRPPSSTTTTQPGSDHGGGGSGGGDGSGSAPGGGPASPGAPSGGDSADPGVGVIPPEAQAQIAAVKRSRSSSTALLLEALKPLQDLGVSESDAIAAGFGRFPVGGYATYSHDWLFPRFVPEFHMHQGTDVFAAMGTPVRAPADGVVKITNGLIGGLAVYVTEPDGTYYYMSHLAGLADGVVDGLQVKTGDVVGSVGDSGNAKGGAPHVHFEIHPKGGGPVDPKAILDQWLVEALAKVPALIGQRSVDVPRTVIATSGTRRLAEGLTAPAQAQLMWASSANPVMGALQLAQAEVAGAARRVDWDEVARRQEAEARAWAKERDDAAKVLDPLTPPLLRKTFTG